MTISRHRLSRIAVAALGVFVMGAASADRALAQSAKVTLTLNANVQLTKLHPDVKEVQLLCSAQFADGSSRNGTSYEAVLNRALNKTMQATLTFLSTDFADSANRTVPVTCRVRLGTGPALGEVRTANYEATYIDAAATASQPTAILPNNWHLVATGSTVTWTQSVTFPNIAP
jgi:hypothetical protein